MEVRLKFKKNIHPSFLVRMFSFSRYPKAKIGFEFNYKAFLTGFSTSEIENFDIDNLTQGERMGHIIYGAALEYCRIKKKKIFFEREDIEDALLKASLETNQKILKGLSEAQMPEWLKKVMDNLPSKEQIVKKKSQ